MAHIGEQTKIYEIPEPVSIPNTVPEEVEVPEYESVPA